MYQISEINYTVENEASSYAPLLHLFLTNLRSKNKIQMFEDSCLAKAS